MSTLIVEICKIDKIEVHPNADRLSIATVKGWKCIVRKDEYKVGNHIVYIPIDSILPESLEKKIFGPDSKITLNKHRIRTIKIRQAYSQGLVVDKSTVGLSIKTKLGADVTEKLGITKYEPPPPKMPGMSNNKRSRKNPNPDFKKYTGIENIKNYNELFEPHDIVVVTEKIHGTNFRAGWVKYDPCTLWKKIKSLFGVAPEYEFVFGSHNIELSNKMLKNIYYYETNVYAEIVVRYDLKNRIDKGMVVYGEIYGHGIQKGYSYGLAEGEFNLAAFDVMCDGRYLDPSEFYRYCNYKDIPTVPYMYKGPFGNLDIDQIVTCESPLWHEQKIREGVVIKPIVESSSYMGRKILKAISPEYLMKDNTDFH